MAPARGLARLDAAPWCLLLVCGCFTLTSESYIQWFYRLVELGPAVGVDWHALVGNYLFQGMGTLLSVVYMRRRSAAMETPLLLVMLVLHASFAVPASLATTRTAVVVFGYLMALCGGAIQAFYLTQLVLTTKAEQRGVVFGMGYACSSGLTWLLSLVRTRMGQGLPSGLVSSVVFSVAVALLVLLACPAGADAATVAETDRPPDGALDVPAKREALDAANGQGVVTLACATVLLMSVEKSLGFGFPPADIVQGVSVEFSRLFYAAGLVAAGIASDYNRSYGVVCGTAAMVTPFALLALVGEPLPVTVLWSLDYLLYGFFALFRVMLFLDLAVRENGIYLAGVGLMLGRFGDAAGSALCLVLGGSVIVLVGLAGVMLVCALVMALQLFPQLYAPGPTIIYREPPRTAEEEQFGSFAQYFDLSRREQEVLRQTLARHTNAEAAKELFVSESTIKFHMRNLLRKTGCRNRVELRELYAARRQP